MRSAHQIIFKLLTGEHYFAPHEVRLQLQLEGHHVSESACTARMREVRLPRFGSQNLVKRVRKGTTYFEYHIESAVEKAV